MIAQLTGTLVSKKKNKIIIRPDMPIKFTVYLIEVQFVTTGKEMNQGFYAFPFVGWRPYPAIRIGSIKQSIQISRNAISLCND